MENAADALKMAGAVLLFVLALSIIIPLFSHARQTADMILDIRDRETVYINGDLYYKATGTERKVGWETILPTIARAYLENYKVVFHKNLLNNQPIYKISKGNGEYLDKYSLDLETTNNVEYKNVSLANEDSKAEFLCGILYHKYYATQQEFEKKFDVKMEGTISIYEALNTNYEVIEKLGVYYQNDSSAPNANKTQKRIITYSKK